MQHPPSQIADALRQLSESDALRELENRLNAQNAFNLFDAIGVSNQELRHSDFLAFLLRPNEAHGLGDAFLKWFLSHALANSPAPPISSDTLNQWDLSDAHVQREWNNIDLFVTSAQNRLTVIIENKTYTSEHDDQLSRYMEAAKAQGHGGKNRTLIGIYLTRHGEEASHADYLSIGYEAICTELERLCKTNSFINAKSPDVEIVAHHYTRMLRSKKIVDNPNVTKLCRELYAQHQTAFDRIFSEINADTKPIQRSATKQLRDAIGETAGFEVGIPHFYRGISLSHFRPTSWANGESEWPVYLQTEVYSDGRVVIAGVIAPCKPTLRAYLLQAVQSLTASVVINAGSGYIAFYLWTLRPPHHEAEIQDVDFLREAWEIWLMAEGAKFVALIQPGDFPVV